MRRIHRKIHTSPRTIDLSNCAAAAPRFTRPTLLTSHSTRPTMRGIAQKIHTHALALFPTLRANAHLSHTDPPPLTLRMIPTRLLIGCCTRHISPHHRGQKDHPTQHLATSQSPQKSLSSPQKHPSHKHGQTLQSPLFAATAVFASQNQPSKNTNLFDLDASSTRRAVRSSMTPVFSPLSQQCVLPLPPSASLVSIVIGHENETSGLTPSFRITRFNTLSCPHTHIQFRLPPSASLVSIDFVRCCQSNRTHRSSYRFV